MPIRPAGVLPVAAALLLAACGGLPTRGGGAEIYDLDPYLAVRGRSAPAAPAVGAPSFPLPVLVEAIASLPAAAGPTAATPTRAADLPPVAGPAEIGVIDRPAPVPAAAIALPVPAMPAAVAAAVAPAAAASTPRPAAAAPATVKPAAATAPAPLAAAAVPAAKTARELFARVGDEIEIVLDGPGFLFLGFADRQLDGMTFKARSVKDGRTSFTFKALALGTWDLDFQQQDAATGTSRVESVRVRVLEEADFAAAVQRQAAGGGGTSDVLAELDTGRIAWAEKLAALGKARQAIAELLSGYREGNPDLNDRIANLYAATGDRDAAEKYWRKNAGAAAPYGDRAVVGIARLAVARGDLDGYLAWHRQLLAVTAEPIDGVLVDAAFEAAKQGDAGLGIDLLAEYGRRYPDGDRLDEAVFLTARLLEADSAFRDLKRSRDLYAALLARFPESAHAAEAADRLRWLDQHIFIVR